MMMLSDIHFVCGHLAFTMSEWMNEMLINSLCHTHNVGVKKIKEWMTTKQNLCKKKLSKNFIINGSNFSGVEKKTEYHSKIAIKGKLKSRVP